MLVIGLILSLVRDRPVLFFTLAVYALPFFIGLTAGMAAFHSGAGALGAGPLQKIDGTAGIEFIDFHVGADLNIPAEPFLENAVAEPMHFGEVIDELAAAIRVDQLDHVRPWQN